MTAVSAVNGTEVDLIAAFKLKRLLKTLAAFEGSDGTSLITLVRTLRVGSLLFLPFNMKRA